MTLTPTGEIVTDPGTCDILTTGEDPPPEEPALVSDEWTPSGWRVRTVLIGSTRVGIRRRPTFQTQLWHPTLGVVMHGTWTDPA